ncbi:MAG: MBL fold metallo-hydrolase [Dongiaceae bacterium]
MRITVLGCGGSAGVPRVGNDWGRCDPANPKNRRRRPAILVERGAASVLIDTPPDLRQQLLDARVADLDAVLFTHDHADHTHGIDDLRYLRRGRDAPPIDTYGTPETLAALDRRFGYVFRGAEGGQGAPYRPFLKAHPIRGPFPVAGIDVTPFEQDHGYGNVSIGFRLGTMAYTTDAVGLPEAAFDGALRGLELWIVGCLRFEPHPTHAHFDKAIEWIARAKPKRAVLTGMNQSVDYAAIAARCPPGVEPAYDGLVVEVPD